MGNIVFSLRNYQSKRNKNLVPVLAVVTFNNRVIRKTLPQKVNPDHWNKNKQRATKEVRKNFKLNALINFLGSKVNDYFDKCEREGIEPVENELKRILNKTKVETGKNDINFFDVYDKFLEYQKIKRSYETYKSDKVVKKYLQDYENWSGTGLTFKEMNNDFFIKFETYSMTVKRISNNYFAKIIRGLKKFLVWTEKQGNHVNIEYRGFKANEKEKDIIYLTWEELNRLYKLELTNNTLDLARDYYCFGCFTGLRIGDIRDLKHDEIITNDGKIFIQKTITKTKQSATIPLNNKAFEILDKYSESLIFAFPRLSPQKINKYIKECCKIAEIDKPVTVSKYIGGQRYAETKPKHELITMHTSRKTFVTNSMIRGMNTEAIKGITGHVDDRSFRKYKKITQDFLTNEYEKAWNDI